MSHANTAAVRTESSIARSSYSTQMLQSFRRAEVSERFPIKKRGAAATLL